MGRGLARSAPSRASATRRRWSTRTWSKNRTPRREVLSTCCNLDDLDRQQRPPGRRIGTCGREVATQVPTNATTRHYAVDQDRPVRTVAVGGLAGAAGRASPASESKSSVNPAPGKCRPNVAIVLCIGPTDHRVCRCAPTGVGTRREPARRAGAALDATHPRRAHLTPSRQGGNVGRVVLGRSAHCQRPSRWCVCVLVPRPCDQAHSS
jgi:hypothetical protein